MAASTSPSSSGDSLSDVIVGDKFWLRQAQEMVKAGITLPNAAASQLTNTIGWFWTIYSSVVLILVTNTTWVLGIWLKVLLVLPVFALMLAYWMAVQVQMPVSVDFDPRVPIEIQRVHQQAAEKKRELLSAAQTCMAIAACLVIVALFVAFSAPMRHQKDFYAVFLQGRDEILISGTFPSDALVTFSSSPVEVNANCTGNREVSLLEKASSVGDIRSKLKVFCTGDQRVQASWDDKTIRWTMAITAKRVP